MQWDESHYTPKELAKLWHLSQKVVREMFRTNKHVLRITRPGTRTKRAYETLRIPASAAEQQWRQFTLGGSAKHRTAA